jgi:hypothetical protein
MADKILHKRSLTLGSVPTTASILPGELAINVNDGKLFLRQSGSVDQIVNIGESASFAATASYVQTAQTASYALTSSYVSGSIASPGSNTQILYNNAGVVEGASNFVFSGSNVGIGTTSPGAKLEVFGGGINTINNGYSLNNAFAYSSGPEHPVFMGIRGEGTFTVPSYPTSGKLLSSFIGRDALDYLNPSSYGGASIYMETTENFSFTNKGTCIKFRTTANGSNIETEKVVIQQDGSVGIGTPSPTQKLDVNGSIRAQTGAFVSGQRAGYYLLLQSDRNMVLYDNNAPIWSTNTAVSDIRTKTNVVPLEEVLPTLMKLSIIRFNYKPELDMGNEQHIGVIAQEILKYFPDFVYHDTKSDRYLVYYDKLTTVLLKGMQEQQEQIDTLKADIQKIKELLF